MSSDEQQTTNVSDCCRNDENDRAIVHEKNSCCQEELRGEAAAPAAQRSSLSASKRSTAPIQIQTEFSRPDNASTTKPATAAATPTKKDVSWWFSAYEDDDADGDDEEEGIFGGSFQRSRRRKTNSSRQPPRQQKQTTITTTTTTIPLSSSAPTRPGSGVGGLLKDSLKTFAWMSCETTPMTTRPHFDRYNFETTTASPPHPMKRVRSKSLGEEVEAYNRLFPEEQQQQQHQSLKLNLQQQRRQDYEYQNKLLLPDLRKQQQQQPKEEKDVNQQHMDPAFAIGNNYQEEEEYSSPSMAPTGSKLQGAPTGGISNGGAGHGFYLPKNETETTATTINTDIAESTLYGRETEKMPLIPPQSKKYLQQNSDEDDDDDDDMIGKGHSGRDDIDEDSDDEYGLSLKTGNPVWICILYGMINAIIVTPVLMSFASIIYRDDAFAPYMSLLVRLTMVSGIVHQFCFSSFSSLPFAVGQVQDAGLIFLSGMATSIVQYCKSNGLEDTAMLATVTIGLSLCTASLGCGLVLIGRLRLAQYVQMLPTCVVGGYLAYIGWFCGLSGIGLMAGSSDLTLGVVLDQWKFVLPGVLGGLFIYTSARTLRHMAVLPACIILEIILFYAALRLTGTSVETVTQQGWIRQMDPPPEWYHTWDYLRFDKVVWSALPSLALTQLGMIFVVALSSSLDVAAIELELCHPLNYNKELATVGWSNVASGLTGGYTGSYIFSQTIFSLRAGIRSRLAGYVLALCQMIVLVLPIPILSFVPNFFFGSLLSMICIDLMYEWLWDVRKRLTTAEFFINLSTFGFIQVFRVEYGILAGVLLYMACRKIGLDVGTSNESSSICNNSIRSINNNNNNKATNMISSREVELETEIEEIVHDHCYHHHLVEKLAINGQEHILHHHQQQHYKDDPTNHQYQQKYADETGKASCNAFVPEYGSTRQ